MEQGRAGQRPLLHLTILIICMISVGIHSFNLVVSETFLKVVMLYIYTDIDIKSLKVLLIIVKPF
jgi:hypothetical protein